MDSRGPVVIVALDVPTPERALALLDRLDPTQCRVKIGKELFVRAGPSMVEACQRRGFDVFLDLKFHDIPNTVAAACRAATELGVWMLNVHALGGSAMLTAAAEAVTAAARGGRKPWLIAVTLLTSSGVKELAETGVRADVAQQVLRLARLAQDAGLDGLVCSAREAPQLRAALGPKPVLVAPGIRPLGAAADDQQRVQTPAAALASGVDYLVVGRPVTRAADPAAALAAIEAELAEQRRR